MYSVLNNKASLSIIKGRNFVIYSIIESFQIDINIILLTLAQWVRFHWRDCTEMRVCRWQLHTQHYAELVQVLLYPKSYSRLMAFIYPGDKGPCSQIVAALVVSKNVVNMFSFSSPPSKQFNFMPCVTNFDE